MGPNEYPPELMAFVSSNPVPEQPVDLYLSHPDEDTTEGDRKLLNVGNTADKPIELDLDAMEIDIAMTDLFGDTDDAEIDAADAPMPDLFPPMMVNTDGSAADMIPKADKSEARFLESLERTGDDDDLFASLGVSGGHPDGPQSTNNQSSEPKPTPSPASLFASFDPTSQLQGMDGLASSNPNISDTSFDLGIFSDASPSFFENPPDSDVKFSMEMDQLLSMGTSQRKEDGEAHADKKPEV